jgi:hypothetical protein
VAALLENKYFMFMTADKPKNNPAIKSVIGTFSISKCSSWLKRIPNVKHVNPNVKAVLSLSNWLTLT